MLICLKIGNTDGKHFDDALDQMDFWLKFRSLIRFDELCGKPAAWIAWST